MFGADLSDHHLVIWFTTVLQQNLENFPETREDRVFIGGVLGTLKDHFVEADRVDEQAAVDTLDILDWDSLRVQKELINFVTVHGLLVDGFHNDTWDFEVLSVF